MKAITLHQPYAQLIADGRKPYETRSWPPPRDLIGNRIAIHAGQSRAGADFAQKLGMTDLPIGAVLATAVLVAAHKIHDRWRMDGVLYQASSLRKLSMQPDDDPDFRGERFPIDEYGDYSPGRWAWRLVDVVVLDPPIPARGAQGLWNWTAPDWVSTTP